MNKKFTGFCMSVVVLLGLVATEVCAGCEVVEGDKKMPFDGKSLERVLIEKRSLTILNSEFPSLNAIEKTFTGELQTCTNCTERYITCSR